MAGRVRRRLKSGKRRLLEEAAEKKERDQGHVGKSVGWLGANAPGRVDVDGDTVVGERNPRCVAKTPPSRPGLFLSTSRSGHGRR